MAFSTPFWKSLYVVFLGYIFVDHLSAEANNQLPSDSTFQWQGLSFFYQKPDYPRDCNEVHDYCSSSVSSGVYLIKPDGYTEPFEVYCSIDIDSGAWTVILRRYDGAVDFKRNWDEYKSGFGFLLAEFWLGNDKLSFLTNQALYEIRIDITLNNGTLCEVKHNAFRISDEWSDYTVINVGRYERERACEWKESSELDTLDTCNHIDGFTNITDCNDVYNAGCSKDGIYSILPAGWTGSAFEVLCNMSSDGGGWTAAYEVRVDIVSPSRGIFYPKYSRFRIASEDDKYRTTEVGSPSGTGGNSLHLTQKYQFSTYDSDNDGRIYDCAEEHQGGWWHGGFYDSTSIHYCARWPVGNRYWICTRANLNGVYKGSSGVNMFIWDGSFNAHFCGLSYTEMKIRRV